MSFKLQKHVKIINTLESTLDDICREEGISVLFPWGFFLDKQLMEIWDKQKVREDDGLDECKCIGAHDNLLDYIDFWKRA